VLQEKQITHNSTTRTTPQTNNHTNEAMRYHKRCEEKHSNTTAHYPVVSVGVCYTAVDAVAGGFTTGWWAVVLECFSSHLLNSPTPHSTPLKGGAILRVE